MKTITLEDCKNLYTKFKKYTETAEQKEIPVLFMFDIKLNQSIEKFEQNGVDQKEATSMFRVVLNWIGESLIDFVQVGDKVDIYSVDDPYVDYSGKTGVIEHIDDAGQLHGTWGGCALVPGVDKFRVKI